MIVLQPATAAARERVQRVQQAKIAFREAYNFMERHILPDMTADYWQQAHDDMQQAYIRGGANNLMERLLDAVYGELTTRALQGADQEQERAKPADMIPAAS